MRKGARTSVRNDLRPKYDLSQLKGGVRGKYYNQAREGTNLVLIEPDLAEVFRGEESVKRNFRLHLPANVAEYAATATLKVVDFLKIGEL